jgi:hypothetical protein
MSPYFRAFSAVLLFAIAGFAAGNAFAATVDVSWTFDNSATATCADGAKASDFCPLQNFALEERSGQSGSWTRRSAAIGPSVRTFSVLNILPGERCFRMFALTGGGVESAGSNVACVTVPFSPPKGFTITIQIAVSVQANNEIQISTPTVAVAKVE